MFSSEAWLSNSSNFYNGQATQSLRFDDGSSAYLSRTPASAGNRRTWTWSGWVKRGNIGLTGRFMTAGSSVTDPIGFLSNDKLQVQSDTSGYNLQPTQLFRDTSAWYHFVVVHDSTQATASDRLKIYVNGVIVTSFSTSTYPSLNAQSDINNAVIHNIGRRAQTGDEYFDGYMAEINFVDGQALTPTSFGEFKNGVWIAKAYTGSYGTNGFRLQFNQTGTGTASSSTIGADTSGNDNHFSSSGIVASDCDMPDSPENNFATALGSLAEPQDYQSYYKGTYSEGSLKVTGSSSGWSNGSSNFGMTSGKWYAECRINAKAGTGYVRFGMRARPARTYDEYFWNDDGTGQVDGATTPYSSRVGTYTAGDILMVALDLDNSAIYFGKNGTWENSATSSEIANGTTTNAFASGSVIPTDDGYSYFFYCQPYGTGSNITWNFGQDSSFAGLETAQGNSDGGDGTTDFYYTPPTGFLGNTTVNLPEPTISPNETTQADDYFNTVLWTGDNTSSRSITGVGFQPDFSWVKSRSDANNHNITDAVRGVNKQLLTNTSNAESTYTTYITAFGSDGFTVGNDGDVNGSGKTYVAWNWKAGGTAVSNTDGTITSSVSANTDAGFSIVAYQGDDASSATVGHGLSQAPEMVIVKNRQEAISNPAWAIYHSSLGATKYIDLSTTSAEGTATSVWNDTAPTSTVVTIGTADSVNSGSNHIMYCFHSVEGFSKFGSYSGSGNSDGPMIFTGFRPAWIMIKGYAGTDDWIMMDNKRSGYNSENEYLDANNSTAESDGSGNIDFLSNGFKIRSTFSSLNYVTGEYIYMAFAENPFKYTNAR